MKWILVKSDTIHTILTTIRDISIAFFFPGFDTVDDSLSI